MRHHDDRELGNTPPRYKASRHVGEGFTDKRHSRPAVLLQFTRVVETPRRAGSSIADSSDDDVAPRNKVIDDLAGGCGMCFPAVYEISDPLLTCQCRLDSSKKVAGSRFAVVQKTD
jgi:hypothetical protein